MDLVFLILHLATLGLLLYNGKLIRQILDNQRKAWIAAHGKNMALAKGRRSAATPRVDAKSRQSRRGTNDIPTRGGRMSTGVHREKSHGSQQDDS